MDRHTGASRGVARVAATAADARAAAGGARGLPRRPPGGPDRAAAGLGGRGRRARAARRRRRRRAGAGRRARRRGRDAARGRADARRACPSATSSRARAIELGDLRGRPFILAEPGTALRATVLAATQAAGFSPLPLFEVGDPATVRFLVRAGLGSRSCPRPGSSGPDRWSARRISSTRRVTGCRCSRPRRARHRPAGCCTSACSSSSSRRGADARRRASGDRRAVAEEHERRHREDAVAGRPSPGCRRRRA